MKFENLSFQQKSQQEFLDTSIIWVVKNEQLQLVFESWKLNFQLQPINMKSAFLELPMKNIFAYNF